MLNRATPYSSSLLSLTHPFQLTYLSRSSWIQVLQERHLSNKCGYPLCSNSPRVPPRGFNSTPSTSIPTHTSNSSPSTSSDPSKPLTPYAQAKLAASKALPASAPRYRVSLKNRSITLDDSESSTGPNSFCSDICHRGAEWVKRWVLKGSTQDSGDESEEEEGRKIHVGSAKRRITGNELFKKNRKREIKEARQNGGRWERRMEEDKWAEIELLEDLEEKGQVPETGKEDQEETPSEELEEQEKITSSNQMVKEDEGGKDPMSEAEAAARAYTKAVALQNGSTSKLSNPISKSTSNQLAQSAPSSSTRKPPVSTSSPPPAEATSTHDKVKSLIESLVITERFDPSSSSASASTSKFPTNSNKSKSVSFSEVKPTSTSSSREQIPLTPKTRKTKRSAGGGLDLDELLGLDDEDDYGSESDDGLSTAARITRSVQLASRQGLGADFNSNVSVRSRNDLIEKTRGAEDLRKKSLKENGTEMDFGSNDPDQDEELTEEQELQLKKLEEENRELDDLFAIADRENWGRET